jgi:hypothetical protein
MLWVMAKARYRRLERQQAVIDTWRAASPGTGHAAFFQLGVALQSNGMTLTEIGTVLRQEASHGRHVAERRAQIKSILRTLSQPFWRAAA